SRPNGRRYAPRSRPSEGGRRPVLLTTRRPTRCTTGIKGEPGWCAAESVASIHFQVSRTVPRPAACGTELLASRSECVADHVSARQPANRSRAERRPARVQDVDGYTAQTYGESIADVYDEWLDPSQCNTVAALLAELAGAGSRSLPGAVQEAGAAGHSGHR